MGVYVGTSAGLYMVEDRVTEVLGGTRINHIVHSEDVLWVADGKGRIHRDGIVITELPDEVPALCLQPSGTAVMVGSSKARLFHLDEAPVEDEYFAQTPGRDDWYTPWGAPPDVRSMARDIDGTLYVNVHVGGIVRYDNTGPVPTIDVDADVHQVVAHPGLPGAVFAACAYGLAMSSNGHDFDIRDDGLHASYCRAVAVDGDTVFVSASTGPRTKRGRLYRGDLWRGAFEPLSGGLPKWFDDNLNTHCLIARPDGVYAGVGDTVWRSVDNGNTWDAVATSLPKVTCLA